MHISLLFGAIFFCLFPNYYCSEHSDARFVNQETTTPSVPHNFTIRKVTSTEIHLSWAKPSKLHTWGAPPPKPHTALLLAPGHHQEPEYTPEEEEPPQHQPYSSRLLKNGLHIEISNPFLPQNIYHQPWKEINDRFIRRKRNTEDKNPDEILEDEYSSMGNLDVSLIERRVREEFLFKRQKMRRQVDSSTEKLVKDKIDAEGATKVLNGDVAASTEKKVDETSERVLEVKMEDPDEDLINDKLVNYVLFYEEGLAGGVADASWKGGFVNDVPPEKGSPRVKSVLLTHQDGRDGLKGYKYTLRNLKPYYHYRLWLRAFFPKVSPDKSRPTMGPPSPRLTALTDAGPPSAPRVIIAACDQPPGSLLLSWERPSSFGPSLDVYTVTLKRQHGPIHRYPMDTKHEHIETSIKLTVDISDNVTIYEVSLHAATRSIYDPALLINGTETIPKQVNMTSDCLAVPPHQMVFGEGLNGLVPQQGDEAGLPALGYLLMLCIMVMVALFLALVLYRTTAFKKCFPMSYLFLEEGGATSGEEGRSEGGSPKTLLTQEVEASRKPAAAFVSMAENGGEEFLWDALHPPVPHDKFLAHTQALHADGDIGFSKEYELIQSKSAMSGHPSIHSQHPDNRHKNRYLNITAYDHSRVCLLPSSSCACSPGRDHRRSCLGKPCGSPDLTPNSDYINANFIDGIVPEIDSKLAAFIVEQNRKRKTAQEKKEQAAAIAQEITNSKIQQKQEEDSMKESILCLNSSLEDAKLRRLDLGNFEAKIPLSFDQFESAKMMNSVKDKMSLDLNTDKLKASTPGSDILANTCRLSINLDSGNGVQKKGLGEEGGKDTKHEDTKSEKSIKCKKRSTSADTKDIVIDKKASSRGHSKNSSVVVSNDYSPLNGGGPKIEGAFLNIEFSGIVDSERELQEAREAERMEEANRLAREAAEETLDDLDDLYVQIGGEPYRVKSSWLLDRRRYIGTQGPTPGTLPAFWRMVWDHRVASIVMITNLVERGRRKCDMYWPKEGTESYGAIQVTTMKEDVMATYTVRTFQIKNTKVNLIRSVVQYHYTVWPDHGTPEHPLAVLRFRQAARRDHNDQAVLVHCSAGVGRTGTYIVLDAMLNHLRLTGSLNVFGFLCHVRSQRNFLVQTEEQYVFIHDALLEAIQSGDTEVPAENAKDYLRKLLEPFPEGHSLLQPNTNQKSGLYGAPIEENKQTLLKDINEINNSLNMQNNGDMPKEDFAVWSDNYNDERSLDDCRDELVSLSLQTKGPTAAFSVETRDRSKMMQLPGCNGESELRNGEMQNGKIDDEAVKENDEVIQTNPEKVDVLLDIEVANNPVINENTSPGLIMDLEETNNVNVLKNKNLLNNDLVDVNKLETASINSLNMAKSDRSTSYEKLNGTCTKSDNSNNSKASSLSNEEVEQLPVESNSSEIRVNGKFEENNGHLLVNERSNTVTSSVSSNDTNNLNGTPVATHFRVEKLANYSPGGPASGQDNSEAFRRERNTRSRSDDNYSVVGGARHGGLSGAGGDSCFAGAHRYTCQRREDIGRPPRNLLEHQFKLVTMFEPSKFHTVSACKQVNVSKNRSGAVLPVDSGRVPLMSKPGVEGSDYINATWLQGHRSLREYVVTQHPLLHTVEDVYRMLWDHSCQLMVVLTDTGDHQQDCQMFWPTEECPEVTIYNYNIRFVSKERLVARRKSFSNSKSNPEETKADDAEQARNDQSFDSGFYRRQCSNDNQDEERLIPKSEDGPSSLECVNTDEELKKLNQNQMSNSDGYAFDKAELRIETLSNENSPTSETSKAKISPKKIGNGDIFGEETKKCKSPSRLSLKSFKLSSPVLKSPTKFKFDFAARLSVNSKMSDTEATQDRAEEPKKLESPQFEHKFEMIPFKEATQNCEEISRDCIITATELSMNSLQDDYELRVRMIECPKWLSDLDYDDSSDTDDDSGDEDFEMDPKALEFIMEQRLKAYRGAFGLPEYVAKCQDEFKNSPVVIMDKVGGARAVSLCTLCAALRRPARDVYSLAKLHHGRRAGAWRSGQDLRALYEALAAYH